MTIRMPLPWKKAKGKRFSQLLTDHLVPPKRGASLVIETGFPTSLADLFVKNRNNISINKRKKKKKNETSTLIPTPDPSDWPNPEPTQNSSTSSSSSICAPLTPPRLLSIPQIPHDVAVDDWMASCEAIDHDKINGEVAKGKDVFMAVLKMFFVVILALGANKFAVGIALSAFLFIFIEYLGRRFGGLRLFQLLKRHKKLAKGPNEELQFDNHCNLGSSKDSLDYPSTCEMGGSISEIQNFKPSSNLVPHIHEIPNVEFNVRSSKEKWMMKEITEKREDEVKEQKKQEDCMYQSELLLCDGNTGKDSRRSTMRSKIKKFASKLNNSKRKHRKKKAKESKFDAFGYENAKATNWGDIEREFEVIRDDDLTPLSSIGEAPDDQINLEDSISPENSSISNNNTVEDGKGREMTSSSGGYLAILVIVLAGLVGSRLLALAFALSWFFLLKSKLGTRLGYITSGYL